MLNNNYIYKMDQVLHFEIQLAQVYQAFRHVGTLFQS